MILTARGPRRHRTRAAGTAAPVAEGVGLVLWGLFADQFGGGPDCWLDEISSASGDESPEALLGDFNQLTSLLVHSQKRGGERLMRRLIATHARDWERAGRQMSPHLSRRTNYRARRPKPVGSQSRTHFTAGLDPETQEWWFAGAAAPAFAEPSCVPLVAALVKRAYLFVQQGVATN